MTRAIKLLIIFTTLLFSGIRFGPVAQASDTSAVRWEIRGHQYVDKAQAERIVVAAQNWVADNVARRDRMPATTLTIHVGDTCPDASLRGPCISVGTAELYLPSWDEAAASSVAHAAILIAMTNLVDRAEITRTVV